MMRLSRRSARDALEQRYEVERTIGHGGMASVFAAYDRELDRPVALKLLADNLAGDEESQERFKREARIAARLSHPNIVAIFDVGEEEGRPFIVMEYVEGESLAEVLKENGPLAPDRAVELVRQACAALGHAHEAGVVHRDVKPKNLLLREDGVLKVADFGIARAAEVAGLTQVGQVIGTPPYIAPEQMHGRDVSPATDVYGLGVLLHHLITGHSPYSGRGLFELLEQQKAKRFEPLRRGAPGASAELEEIVARCLEPSRRKRIRTTAALDSKLAALELGGVPAAVAETPDPEPNPDPEPEPPALEPAPVEAEPADGGTAVLSFDDLVGSGLAQLRSLREKSAAATRRAREKRAARIAKATRPRRRRRISGRIAAVIGIIVLAVAVEVAAVALISSGSDEPAEQSAAAAGESGPSVPTSDAPAQQARNLADWLRDNSR